MTDMMPCWIELSSPDVEESKEFYSAVFGWHFDGVGPLGLGTRATSHGRSVAGISEQPQQAPQGQPGFWSLYFQVSDFDQLMESVAQHGGHALMAIPQFDAEASVALVADPHQTGFGVLAFSDERGFEVTDDTGSAVWFELNTKDVADTEFYTSVFGWSAHRGSNGTTTLSASNGLEFGQVADISELPIPPHWKIYLKVDSVENTIQRATAAGGAVLAAPADTPRGRVAQIIDCHNAAIAIVESR